MFAHRTKDMEYIRCIEFFVTVGWLLGGFFRQRNVIPLLGCCDVWHNFCCQNLQFHCDVHSEFPCYATGWHMTCENYRCCEISIFFLLLSFPKLSLIDLWLWIVCCESEFVANRKSMSSIHWRKHKSERRARVFFGRQFLWDLSTPPSSTFLAPTIAVWELCPAFYLFISILFLFCLQHFVFSECYDDFIIL